MTLERLGRGVRFALLAVAIALPAAPVAKAAEGTFTAFKVAVAEAAAGDRDIAAFYRSNGFEPVWTGADEADRARRSALLSAMQTVGLHGLPENRHDAGRLMNILASVRSPRERGMAEVAMSRAFVRLARAMQSGALVPAAIDEGIKREVVYRDATAYLTEIAGTDSPRAYFRSIVPQTREYVRLMKEKLRLERLIGRGGWGAPVPARALEPGDSGTAVVALRDRLMRMGYLDRSVTMVYDEGITQAVSEFQARHGLAIDGKAGANTMAQINIPAAARLRSVIVAMERERWLNRDRGSRHILVNLTDFSARIIDNDRITFQTRAVIGANARDRRTPEFSDQMEHMIVNPTWHVPRSIAVKEYLPQFKANPGAAGHLRLYDWRGRQVSRAGVNFDAYNAQNFPFDLKQPPSNSNALGLVKFMFPNKYNIYLHDTPAKHLFQSARRAYSHGCIRLNEPFEFAYHLLARQEENPEQAFQRVLATGRETQVDLKQPVPVHLIYRTAFTDAHGRMQYREDVYGRDAKIWNALMREGVASVATSAGVWQPRQARAAQVPEPEPARVLQPASAFQPTQVRFVPRSQRVAGDDTRSLGNQTRRIDR